ncbi:MAG: hypothetical protein O3C28_07910 [Proteobacteria bacterium]|nr:hypothetical protein [Pseudomonadota bacterium]
MQAKTAAKETQFYWNIADDFLSRESVDQGSLMGFPCLRVNGDFFSTCEHRSGDLIVKLPKARVCELIELGRGEAFAPAGRVFKEWLLVKRRNKKSWFALMDESMNYVAAERK